MKRILMLLIIASLFCGCNAAKETKATTNSLSKAIEKKLQDVWVLEEMNGKKVTEDDFAKKMPKLELITSTETFTGNSGCNAIKGFLFSKEKGELQFLNITSEKKNCPAAKKEDDFLKLLKTTTNYSTKDGKLW
jgi:heat shock protein HslJ